MSRERTARALILIALLLSGCAQSAAYGETEPPAETPVALAAVTVPALPTASPASIIPSPRPTDTETATPTASPTATETPTPVPTNTATPTQTVPPTQTPPATETAEALPTETATELPTATPTYPPAPASVNVPILMYHYISEIPPDADVYRLDLTVTPDRFAAQLGYLRDQGYQTVRLADIYETLMTGKPLPERPIVLSFDDGYADAYSQALPLLQAYGFVGEFFVLATPAHFEAPQYLTWNEMQIMAQSGMSIEAHGRDHYDLTNRGYEFLVYQILGAREAVEAHTGQPVTFFCYPSGRYDADTQAVVASAGYLGAVTTEWGTELRLDNRYAWPRVRIKGAWDLQQFADVLASLN